MAGNRECERLLFILFEIRSLDPRFVAGSRVLPEGCEQFLLQPV
jgi:hypothetical protein